MAAEATISIQNQIMNESNQPPPKKKRNLPGTPDPEAEVIALSPKTLMATNRFVCEICMKGFQRDQNLQLHRRGHNLPWKLKRIRASDEVVRKRVYVCPEKTCIHHHASRALGDLTGIKKHFCRKHGEKKWKCEKCSKRYAVQSDWKAHAKTCGTREYRCDCGTIFSRRDSFITHRAFCDALAQETARVTASSRIMNNHLPNLNYNFLQSSSPSSLPIMGHHFPFNPINNQNFDPIPTTRFLPLSMEDHCPSNVQDYSTPKNNNLPETHTIGSLSAPNNLTNNNDHHDQIIFTNTSSVPHLPPSVHNSNWDFGHKFASNNVHPIPFLTNPKEAISVPSLFSSQNQTIHQPDSSARMSATALLQKAAQIGATSTTNHSHSFLQKFDLQCSGDHNAISPAQVDGNRLCGLVYSTSSATSGLGSDDVVENSVDEISAVNHHQLRQMYGPDSNKRRRLQNEEITQREITRDFLGVHQCMGGGYDYN